MTFSDSGWHIIGSSVTGTSHLHMGRGCDDAHSYRVCADDLVLLAVADGAGSASYSADGAVCSVQVALDTAERLLFQQQEPVHEDEWHSVLSLILQAVREKLLALVEQRNSLQQEMNGEQPSAPPQLALRDFAATLLIAIISSHWIAVAQVGDGAVVLQHTDGTLTSLTPRSYGEYVNETNFVTDEDYLLQTEYTTLPRANFRGIALLTDGLQMIALKRPENIPHQPFFAPLFRFTASPDATEVELRTFLESQRVNERTDDDKTLILAVYR